MTGKREVIDEPDEFETDDVDSDDFETDDFDLDENEISNKSGQWRLVEQMMEQRWLKQQISDFDDYVLDY